MARVVHLVKETETEVLVRYRFGAREGETSGLLELDKVHGVFRLVNPSRGDDAASQYSGARYAIAQERRRGGGYADRLSFMS